MKKMLLILLLSIIPLQSGAFEIVWKRGSAGTGIIDVKINHTGTKIYTAEGDKHIRVYDISDGSLLNEYQMEREIQSFDISDDERYLAVTIYHFDLGYHHHTDVFDLDSNKRLFRNRLEDLILDEGHRELRILQGTPATFFIKNPFRILVATWGSYYVGRYTRHFGRFYNWTIDGDYLGCLDSISGITKPVLSFDRNLFALSAINEYSFSIMYDQVMYGGCRVITFLNNFQKGVTSFSSFDDWSSQGPADETYHIDKVTSLALQHDSKILAGNIEDGTTILWELPSGDSLTKIKTRKIGRLTDMEYTFDDKYLVASFSDNFIRLIRPETSLSLEEIQPFGRYKEIMIKTHPHIKHIVAASEEGNMALLLPDVYKDTLVSRFVASPLEGIAPLKVNFSDASSGSPIEWLWDFGDNAASTEQNPTHLFKAPGVYSVGLRVRNAKGMDSTAAKVRVIEDLKPDFSAEPLSGPASLQVRFTDESDGNPVKWLWHFGDGDSSEYQNPIHTYAEPGIYSVKLKAENEDIINSKIKYDYISVFEQVTADFEVSPQSGFAPLSVSFTDLSEGNPNEWKWDFGDGSGSDEQNPMHTYLLPGYYSVSLEAANGPNSSDAVSRPNYVVVREDPGAVEDRNDRYFIRINDGILTVSTAKFLESLRISIYDILGKQILSKTVGNIVRGQEIVMDISSCIHYPGLYMLNLCTDEWNACRKIMINK